MKMHPRLIVIIPEHAFPDSLQMLLLTIVLNRKRSNVQFLKVQAFQNHTFATLKIKDNQLKLQRPMKSPEKAGSKT